MKKLMLVIMLAVFGLTVSTESYALFGFGKKKKKEMVYRIGLSADFAPFEYREGDKIVGFDPELAELISKESGLKFEIVDIAFSGLLSALQTKKIDIILSGMSVTEERKKAVNFSKAYFNVSQVILVKEKTTSINGKEDLVGKKIGVQLGTTSDTIAQEIEGISLKQYDAASGAVLELKSDKLDAIILDYQLAHNFAKNNKGLVILEKELAVEEYAMALRKDDTELKSKIDAALDKIIDSEDYDKLMEKYIVK